MEYVAVYVFNRRLRRERRYRDPLDPLHVSDEHLLRVYRFPRQEIIRLCDELRPHLERRTRRAHALPTHTQVLAALRFFASGSFQTVIGDTVGMDQSSVSRAIDKVTQVLCVKASQEIKMPTTAIDINRAMQDFRRTGNFPRVIGAIDGAHIRIKAPEENEEIYVNRKQFHSLNIQAVGDTNNKIISYDASYPGSTHDSFTWRHCALKQRFLAGHFGDALLIGDSGYPLEPFLMTPVVHPTTPGEERYNQSHRRTRCIVERTFGILKSRFRCLHESGGSLQYDPEKTMKIATSCMLLHNYCVDRRIPYVGDLVQEEEVPVQPVRDNRQVPGQVVRQEIIRNFFS
ncbi:putative nuclease HARBI1 [Eriocheir sinensis]|uniref:putative nuclease HARBI1 n=1 Tax=Eriocheir sinensis TaxID=95602 RepID=UPI0021C77DC1|nr:putative nuclease HARBI1 [Eriocheir sinensis]XP_050707635.1 putative nuclease HARBI1 [Eriocheir sinensis]